MRPDAPVAVPTLDPCTTLACVRLCVPDEGPINETVLRAFLPEIDAVLAESQRAESRRYETGSELEAAA